MLQLFMDKQFIPVVASALTVLLILVTRPSFFVNSSTDKNCPYCLKTWLIAAVVLAVGGGAYIFVNKDAVKPQLGMYSSK